MEVSGRRQLGSDDLSTGILCDPCKGEHEEENAVFYCTVCIEFLCDACTKAHRRSKLLKHHQLLDRDSMPKEKLTSSASMCTTHNGKLLEYYCQIHDDCCCSVCATLEHKQCKVDYIDDIAMEFQNTKEYKSLLSAIANITQLLKNTKKISLKNKDDVGKIHMKFVSEVKKFRSEINQMLDSLEQSTVLEAQTLMDKDTKSTESASTTCDVIMADLEEMSSNMDTQKKYKQKRQLVISAKKFQNEIKQYDTIIAELTNQCEIQDYAFRPNDIIIQSIKTLNSLGKLENKTKEESKTKIQRKKVMKPEKTPVPSKSLSLRYVGEVDIKHQTDTTSNCCITGGVMLDNNMLTLVDFNNDSVKLVDININKVISCIKPHASPYDITRVERDQIVVTCCNTLVFIKVCEILSVVKEVELDGECRGIVYTNNTLIVCCLNPVCVKILDLNGHILKTITTDKKGNVLFDTPYYIALSTDKRTLYVSDKFNHTVTCMDIHGAVQHVYKHDKLKYPKGLAVDREGNIYIAGWGSNNIHIISPQCTTCTIQVIPEMNKPHVVIYCEKDNRLYIGRRLVNRTFSISIYQIQ